MITRVPVLEVRPCLDRGRFPAKIVPGEPLTVEAIVLPDDVEVGAAVVLTDPTGTTREPVPMTHLGDHLWSATVTADVVGSWTYHVESWQEPLRTWAGRVVADIDHGVDAETVLAHGSALVIALGDRDPAALEVGAELLDTDAPAHERLAVALAYVASLPADLGRVHVDTTDPLPLRVDPERALVGSWYELTPHDDETLATATRRLEHAAALGFDVVRLPPVHPTRDLPWSPGPALDEHTSIDPRLGDLDALLAFVEQAHRLGLEVALELSWTFTSDHPWLIQHASWCVPVGEDVWRLDPDADPAGVLTTVLDVMLTWVSRGIGAFVVPDAHRWPLALWEHLLRSLSEAAPDVVLLAEGDPSAAQSHALGLVGFHQTTPPLHRALGVHDVEQVLDTLGRGSTSRHHLLASSARHHAAADRDAGSATRCAWAAVAALSSPAWGVAADLEQDNGPTADGPDVAELLTRLNALRRSHPSLRRRRRLQVHPVHHAGVVAFTRTVDDDTVLVVVDLFPAFSKTVDVQCPFVGGDVRLQDQLDGTWHTVESIALSPERPVRVLVARR